LNNPNGTALIWTVILTSTVAQAQVSPQRLVAAYPNFLASADGQLLIWKDGTRTPFSSGQPFASPADRLNRPDVQEMLRQPYPACTPFHAPAYAADPRPEDPGRARPAAFFGKMYGDSPAAVKAHLVSVNWFGQKVLFSRVNGANLALEAVARDLASQPKVRKYLVPSAGTYLWRVVAGSPRQSAHSWGISIDLNTKYSAYWQWEGQREFSPNIRFRNQIPQVIVHAFERRGFVWGGRWYHHDTMHFEFRPELSGC
jgi:D-alanyl-D-alanine carboxypeptidase